jgi:hypothetical protein
MGIELKNITLIEYEGVDPELGVKSLLYSSKNIEFHKIILFSYYKPFNLTDKIEFIQLESMSYLESTKFSLFKLNDYIDSEFCLSIGTDGYIIHPGLWKNEFLNYDYIGAPWPLRPPWAPYIDFHNRVGNGGFVLKSKKLLELCKNVPYYKEGDHDDGVICDFNRKYFEQCGCKFAPVEIAMKFSLELSIDECEHNLDNTFGFHGKNCSEKHKFYCDMIKNMR